MHPLCYPGAGNWSFQEWPGCPNRVGKAIGITCISSVSIGIAGINIRPVWNLHIFSVPPGGSDGFGGRDDERCLIISV